jgi:hypothetical protein
MPKPNIIPRGGGTSTSKPWEDREDSRTEKKSLAEMMRERIESKGK